MCSNIRLWQTEIVVYLDRFSWRQSRGLLDAAHPSVLRLAVNHVRRVTAASEVPLNHGFCAFLISLSGLPFIFLLEVLLSLGGETLALSHLEGLQIGEESLLKVGSVLGFVEELLMLLQYLFGRGPILWCLLQTGADEISEFN